MQADNTDAKPKSGLTPARAARYWTHQIAQAEREQKDWVDDGSRVEKKYRIEKREMLKGKRSGKRFNILYSNTETLKSALYARTPKPDVRRRFADRNPVARMGADIIERALIYCADTSRHDQAYRAGVQDSVLPGRGVVWYCYEAETEKVPAIDPASGQAMIGHNGGPVLEESISKQECKEEYVYWKDFLHTPCQHWDHVWWVARRHRMDRDDMRENEFANVDEVPLNWEPTSDDKRETPEDLKRAEVWEIWDKSKKQRVWIVKGYPKALKIEDDPYGLEHFFPCAEPLYGIRGNDTLLPTPDFHAYSDQADDLDEITSRISVLTKALRRRGVRDSSVKELERLGKAGDNEFIPVDGQKYALMAQKGGLPAAFQVEDIEPAAKVLLELYKQRDQLIQTIYEVTGISDIMRGASKPSETATAQNIKAQFGSMRLKDRQASVQKWVRDGYRIKAELICEHYEPETLAEITGFNPQDPNFMQAVQLIKSDKGRGYQIDIETDSTIFEDAEQEKQSRVEMLTAVGGMAQQWLPIVQAAPEMIKLFGEMLAFGVRGFKAGRQLEDVIDETMQQVGQRIMQQMQNPQPDPEAEKAKAEMEMQKQTHEMDMAGKQFDQQAKVIDLQVHQQKAQIDLQKAERGAQIEAMKAEHQLAMAAANPANTSGPAR